MILILKRNKIHIKVIILLFVALTISIISCKQSSENQLPIYNPADMDDRVVDNSLQKVNKNHTVADFKLINQNGEIITQEDYKDKIYVADFFFTSCKTICPIMTDNIGKLQQEYLFESDIMFLSISVTPEIDSIPVLRAYADDKGVIDSKWNITTGDKKHIYTLARKSYFAALDQGDGGLQDFIHTTNFVLVDKKKQIRGIYDGTSDDEIERLINDIKVLAN